MAALRHVVPPLATVALIYMHILICTGLQSPVHGFQLPVPAGSVSSRHSRRQWNYQANVIDTSRPTRRSSQVAVLHQSSTSNSNSNGNRPPSKRRRAVLKVKNLITGVQRGTVTFATTLLGKFKRLSKKSKVLVCAYMLVVSLILGSVGRSVYLKRTSPDFPMNPKRPIEITYSSFMDLVEQQQQQQPVQPQSSSSPSIQSLTRAATKQPESSTSQSSTIPKVDKVKIAADRISFRLSKPDNEGGTKYLTAYTRKPPASPELLGYLRQHNLDFTAASVQRNVIMVYTLRSCLFTLYGLFLWRMYQTMRSNSGQSSSDVPGKLLQQSERPLASFTDIQGIDDAKNEVMELVDTLRNPSKYAILGARAPTGLLLEGPPGTGKTMLARATAATAGVPLLYCSGSDFIELYVGRGAGRVRRMFERAIKLAPCIIFIDELDTLGKARDSGSNGLLGGMPSRANDEAEQTLNQLLSCMDGLDSSRRICVLAATNRKDVLDQALIRPGRFDRIVTLRLPNAQGRENILRVHANKLPGFEECNGVDPDRANALGKGKTIDLSAVAAITDGLSGAELEFIVNEAAIRAVRRVSGALRQGANPETLVSHVDASDFEASVANFFATRRKGGNNNPAGDVWKNMFQS
ncbi:zinc metalloprotease FTSH, chloroplastic [Seminavis robusta]|uniref:Zinc metalloprotease FTSH, chloroplastic n=1 Tax=Seminavis robusta TaxID=568900 RepID=A0A9N8DD79_9STRA|nr:zinc metalloprotease FTSH, chloroplastic [Seminavis robusta]|eukprot:Sro21_g014710.1 zinc metalloprotease FTSH, chloroplastic (635) ;mRNA; f:81187-83236